MKRYYIYENVKSVPRYVGAIMRGVFFDWTEDKRKAWLFTKKEACEVIALSGRPGWVFTAEEFKT